MLRIEWHPPDTDKWELEFPCPICLLQTPLLIGQIRREEYFICRGCYSVIKAIDFMGGAQQLKYALRDLFK